MKRFFSILLLLIFLFNTVGYRLAFFYLIKEVDSQLELKAEKIDERDQHLVTLKIPINLPYQNDWKDFQPTDGETVINGISYKYVKRKMSRDTLILLCLQNPDKTKLEKSSDDFFKKSNGLDRNTSKKADQKQAQEFCIFRAKPQFLIAKNLPHQFYTDKRSIVLPQGYQRFIENPPQKSC